MWEFCIWISQMHLGSTFDWLSHYAAAIMRSGTPVLLHHGSFSMYVFTGYLRRLSPGKKGASSLNLNNMSRVHGCFRQYRLKKKLKTKILKYGHR